MNTAAAPPPQPLWLTVVRGIQFFLALVTLALSGFSLSYFGSYSGYGLNIFTSILTFIFIGYIVASTMAAPGIYNVWIAIAFQALLAIFWLATFGTLAALSVAFNAVQDYSYEYDGYIYNTDYTYTGRAKAAVDTTKAATALTAFIWISFCATLIYTVLTAFRGGSFSTTAAAAPVQEHKLEAVAGQPTATSYQPVQQYPTGAQPYAAPVAQYPPQQEYQQPQQQFQQQPVYPVQTPSPAPYPSPVQYQNTGEQFQPTHQQPTYQPAHEAPA